VGAKLLLFFYIKKLVLIEKVLFLLQNVLFMLLYSKIFCNFAPDMKDKAILQQRNDDLRATYERVNKASEGMLYISSSSLLSIVAEEPAPRFYINPRWAREIIRRYYKGIATPTTRRDMIEDLVDNYERLKVLYPKARKKQLFRLLVEQPARSFYLSPYSIRDIVFNYKRHPHHEKTSQTH